MGKQRKIPKIAKRFKKILKGKERGKGEGLTKTVGLTKGQGLASLPPGLTLESIVKKIPKGKKLKKTIFKKAQKGTKESDMKKKKYIGIGGYHNQRSNNNNNKTDAKSVQKNAVEKQKEPRTIKQAKDAGKDYFINKAGKRLAAVTKEELEASGMSLRDYLNEQKGLTRRDGKKVTKTTKKDDKLKKGTTDIFKVKKGESTTRAADAKTKRETAQKKLGRGFTLKGKPTTDIFKIKKGESTTRAADAKKKQEAAQKKLGRGLTMPGKAEPKKLTAKERKNQQLAKLSFRSAQAMKEGPGRDKAMERARKIQQRNLPKKTTKNYPAENLVKKGRIIFGTDKKENRLANKMNRGGFIKTGDGDKFVKKAYGGRVGS